MPLEADDDTVLSLLIDALDGDDDVRCVLVVALALMGTPTDQDRDRLRRGDYLPVFRL